MNNDYLLARNILQEVESLRSRANYLRVCSKHSGVEFDLIARADEYDDKARILEESQ